jgi:tetratricopeptide (TPR) repeat protein
MRHPLSPTTAAALLLMLGGCTTTTDVSMPKAWRVEPVMQVQHSTQSAQAYYQLGRYHDGSQEWESAVEAYGKAIAADPTHVEAHNALGVAWARLGRYAAAETALRRGLSLDPLRAHLHSNLGHVLMLAGRAEASVAVLREALGLDGQDTVARSNLAEALSRMPAAATQGRTAASDEKPHAATTMPLLDVVSAPTVAAWVPVAGTPEPSPAAVTPAAAAVPAVPDVHVELSNGGGVAGAAARMKQWLGTRGLPIHRLTNQRPYQQRQTVVQYRSGHEAAARHLARVLGVVVPLQPVDDLRSGVRVVLGRDLQSQAGCLAGRCTLPDAVLATASSSSGAE